MSDLDSDPTIIRRAIVQKLESLYRGGVRDFPRSRIAAPVSPPEAAPKPSPMARDESVKPSPVKPPDGLVSAGQPPSPSTENVQPLANRRADTAVFSEMPLPSEERGPALTVLSEEVAKCALCPELARTRKQTVFGVGNPNARLVFFGEAPGADEDRMGEPFVGKAGQLLTKIIEACTLKREDVYIMNVLRCRPPGNRNPTPEESRNCRPFFERQFDIIRPEFVCCLGSIAASTLLGTTTPVGRLRGKFHDQSGMKVVVTYHPAYLLRNAGAKKHVWADMKMLMKEMGIEV